MSDLRSVLVGPDAEQALSSALLLLESLGVREAQAADTPSLRLEHGGRELHLVLTRPIEDTTRDLLACVLQTALVRVVEQTDFARLKERMQMLSAASFEGIMIHVDGVIIDANARLGEMLGYAHHEIVGANTIRLCVAPEDMPEILHRMANRIEGEYVITGVRKDGSRFRAELNSKQGRLGDRPVRVVAVRDVTNRERMTTLLKESETRFRDLAEQAFDAMVLSRDGVVVDVGGSLESLLGRKREDLIGRRLIEFVAPSAQEITRQVLAEGRAGSYETVIVDAAGEPVPVEVVGVMSTLGGEPVRVAGLRDLREVRRLESERRRLEQLVEQSQRLDSLGVLAGGIAHDFNNLLVGVLGNADLLRSRLTDPLDQELVDAITAAGRSAADLTRQMLAYAGKGHLGLPKPLDVGSLCRELQPLIGASLSKKAQVEFAIEPGTVIEGDRATITQVLMNLLTNASDALGGQPGFIKVRSRRVHEPDQRWQNALGKTVGPGQWVLVEVEDTGAGMDAATRSRVFEPFFTTKEMGHGLGLAACLGIVSAHGGAVLVKSDPGMGSCFSLLFPASSAVGTPAPLVAQTRVGSPCTVLVIDDEPMVRSQLRRSLGQHGYAVHEAPDGRSALAELASTNPDVIVLDMSMPDLDGADVLARLRAMGSRVPVVLSSGYVDAAVSARLDPAMYQGHLSKPYGVAELIDALERARARR